MEATFSRGPARQPATEVKDPILQWSSGLPTTDRRIYAGWLCETRQNTDLDQALEKAGFGRAMIKHGSGNICCHWVIPTAALFIVADGIQTLSEMSHTDQRYGIAFGWKTLQNGRQQSHLRARVFLHQLADVGYIEPLLLTAKGTITGDLIAAFLFNYNVLTSVDALRAQDQKPPMNPPYYAVSLPIGVGSEVNRGSGEQKKDITPPISCVPQETTKDYILSHWVPYPLVARIESLLDTTILWSERVSRDIRSGRDGMVGHV